MRESARPPWKLLIPPPPPHPPTLCCRFVQFFIAPLISEEGVEREAKAVDSE